MKYFYIVYSIKQDKNSNIFLPRQIDEYKEGHLAQVMRVSEMDNVYAMLDSWAGIEFANICASKKQAKEIAAAWNESYKKNGTYFFDTPFCDP